MGVVSVMELTKELTFIRAIKNDETLKKAIELLSKANYFSHLGYLNSPVEQLANVIIKDECRYYIDTTYTKMIVICVNHGQQKIAIKALINIFIEELFEIVVELSRKYAVTLHNAYWSNVLDFNVVADLLYMIQNDMLPYKDDNIIEVLDQLEQLLK